MPDQHTDAYRLAVVQHPPVLIDRAATLDRAVALIDEAAEHGARLVAFSETFVPGYPSWIGRVRYRFDDALVDELHARLFSQAVNLQSDDLATLSGAARRRGVTVVCGVHERDGSYSRSTLYNTVVVIGPTGEVVNRHRKLVPTGVERGLWGMGDGTGLRVVDTPGGRVGALICFENHMPLARFALYTQAVDIYVAPTVAYGDLWIASMRHIAFEGGCWVLNCGMALHARDIPASFPQRDALFGDAWVHEGDSMIIDPAGRIIAGPLRREYGILYADYDPAPSIAVRRRLDVAGHYGRPDVFRLEVHREPLVPVRFTDTDEPSS